MILNVYNKFKEDPSYTKLAAGDTVQQGMDAIGGQSFYRKNTLERLFRDVQGGLFHPMPLWDQYAFTGDRLLAQ